MFVRCLDSMRALIIVTATSFVFHAGAALAQSSQAPPTERRFEVASVKPALSPAELGRLAAHPMPPTLIGALQPQLGLKLEKQIGPMLVVIIDAADHPTPD